MAEQTAVATVCAVCEQPYHFRWSDTHGVAACGSCGLPYRLYHYEGEGDDSKRVEKPPSIAVKESWLPLARRYWAETHRRTFPAAFDFMSGRGGRTYSGASDDDIEQWDEWLKAHRSEWPEQITEPEEGQ